MNNRLCGVENYKYIVYKIMKMEYKEKHTDSVHLITEQNNVMSCIENQTLTCIEL